MSRLHLIPVFIGLCFVSLSQTEVGKYIKYGDELFDKGDYYYALDYYNKAYSQDSNSVELLWKMAETYRIYKDYREAEKFYSMVYQREEALLYPLSILNLGLMQKQNGKYEEAIETFKQAKKKYARQKKDYPYLKSKREIESCLFAKNQFTDEALNIRALPSPINTKDTEFAHNVINGRLVFSSLKADSTSAEEEVYGKDYHTRLYTVHLSDENPKVEPLKDLNISKMNTGNGSFSIDGKRFYYSLCGEGATQYKCKIMVASFDGEKWSNVDSLGEIVNDPSANNTMPSIGQLEGKEVLFFSSDRADGEGGLDLYYTIIENGNQYGKVRSLKNLNSPENETSPHWSESEQKLYFSSSWFDGFGGLDIFSSQYVEQTFEEPLNMGLPYNSPANDLYFFRKDSVAYLSSNRIGVQYSKNPTCCNDIFQVSIVLPTIIDTIVPEETLEELNKRLPVTLYFHNDEPNPKTRDTVTDINYINSYTGYRAMLEKYQKEYSSGLFGQKAEDAREDIESFFLEYVDQGVKDLETFRDLLLKELQKGQRINVTIKGFASPLAKSDYNVNLTKRRISSLVNYLSEYEKGVFLPYIQDSASNGGYLTFSEVPFGEYESSNLVSDNLNDQKNSVYSRSAGLERKIEIQSVTYVKDSLTDLPLKADKALIDLGTIKSSEKITVRFKLKNTNTHAIDLLPIRVPCECSIAEIDTNHLEPGEETTVQFTFDPEGYSGNVVKSVYVKTKNGQEETRLVLTGTVIP